MNTLAALPLVISVSVAATAAGACGWWGENLEEADIPQVVVGGTDDGIDLETPEGMAAMSRAYRLGQHVPQDMVVARLWAARAAKAGHTGAMSDYAQFLERGIGGPQDLTAAAEWFARAAEAGNANAAHSLANLYFDGLGVPQDRAMAEHWLRTAASAGHPSASAQLASLIWAGEIGAREPDEACLWWQAAISVGFDGDEARCTEQSPELSAADLESIRKRAAGLLAQAGTEEGK